MAKSPEGNEFCPHLKTVLTYPLGTGKTVAQAHNTFQYPWKYFLLKSEEKIEHLDQRKNFNI